MQNEPTTRGPHQFDAKGVAQGRVDYLGRKIVSKGKERDRG